MRAALANLGFIWKHKNLVWELIRNKRLICFLQQYTCRRINIYAYDEYQDPKIRAFMQHF